LVVKCTLLMVFQCP